MLMRPGHHHLDNSHLTSKDCPGIIAGNLWCDIHRTMHHIDREAFEGVLLRCTISTTVIYYSSCYCYHLAYAIERSEAAHRSDMSGFRPPRPSSPQPGRQLDAVAVHVGLLDEASDQAG